MTAGSWGRKEGVRGCGVSRAPVKGEGGGRLGMGEVTARAPAWVRCGFEFYLSL
jgi:hypothetical protein